MSDPTVVPVPTPEAEAILAELAAAGDDFLTPTAAAKILRLQPNTIRRLVRDGDLAHLPIPRSGRIRIPRSEIARLATTVVTVRASA